MRAWSKFGKDEQGNLDENWTQDQGMDVFITVCGIALDKELSDYVTPTLTADKELSKKYRDYLEECLDMDTIYKIIEVCAGMKLNDPKLLDEMATLMAQEDGAT